MSIPLDNKNFPLNTSNWSNATVISDDSTGWNNDNSYYSDIVVDKNGYIHVVWYDWTVGEWGTDEEIFYANYTNTGWSNATCISDIYGWNNGSSENPRIDLDNNGNLHVVWNDDTPGEWGTDQEIMYANRTATGWSNATVISDDNTGWNNDDSYNPDIAIDNNGVIHVVWYDYTDGEWETDEEIFYANCTTTGWSNATCISDDYTLWNDGASRFPIIAIDNNEYLHVVWHDLTNGEWGSDAEIMYANRTASGWSNATCISDLYGWNDGSSYRPKVATDNNGNVHVVWYDYTDTEWGTDTEIMYASYTATGWSNATVISDDSTGWNDMSSDFPDIAIDNQGILHVTWNEATDGEWGSDEEIMYVKYTGTKWTNVTCISDFYGWNDGDSYDSKIAIEPNGKIHVVWEDGTDGEWGNDQEIMYASFSGPSKSTDLLPLVLLMISGPDTLIWAIPIIIIIAIIAAIVLIIIYKKSE